MFLSACKSDGDSNTAGQQATAPVSVAPTSPPSTTPIDPTVPPVTQDPKNAAPVIDGAPLDPAMVGKIFSFQPGASDADGDALSFSISSKPSWAAFDPTTGRLSGTPGAADVGLHEKVVISVSDGAHTQALPQFAVKVVPAHKSNYGHYFATRYADTPADAAMLCEQAGVSGVVWRRTWNEVEPSAGVYDFSSFDEVLGAIAASGNPKCQLWLFVEFKSFKNSPVKNPCPKYLQSQHSGLNADGSGAATCFMWEPAVVDAYVAMMKSAAARFNDSPRVEGLIIQESALGFNGAYSQDVADGGTYTAVAWRDAMIELIGQCGTAFSQSRCMVFMNFLRGGQEYLHDISAAIETVSDNRACFSGPDLLPDNRTLYDRNNKVYEVLVRHDGCRSNSAQNDSFEVAGCGLDCIFQFAVKGSFGDFPESQPLSGGVCVNSYLFWNHRVGRSATGLDWTDALPLIAATPYGRVWYEQCANGGGAP